MAKINLLPWREERRQALKRQFLTVLAAMALLGLAVVFATDRYYAGAIAHQQGRNAYIQQNIDVLNRQVKEIRELEKRKQDLLERMKIIQDLQGKRPLIVRIFDEVVRTLPDGTYFESLDRKDKSISVKGIAESNNRVSSLMRNLDGSEWFAKPNLTAVSAVPEFGEQASKFTLSYVIRTPEDEEKEK